MTPERMTQEQTDEIMRRLYSERGPQPQPEPQRSPQPQPEPQTHAATSDREQPKRKKGHGPYLEVYDEEAYALFSASGEHEELVLRRAVAAYLCREQEPDFSEERNAADLWRAWYHIELYLMRGKHLQEIRREAGKRGGAPKGNHNASKHHPEDEE